MDGNLVFLFLTNEEEARVDRENFRIQNRLLRDASDPIGLPEVNFTQLFRLTRQLARNLCDSLAQHLEVERKTAISPILKILTALFFFAHGFYQKSVSISYLFGLSQSSVSRCINTVSNTFYVHLLNTWVKFPTTDEEKQAVKNRFYQKFQFSGVIGTIDCTHVVIVAPPSEHDQYPAHVYMNRKGYYSINGQIICDADLKILTVNARYPGSVHDATIWTTSIVHQHLCQQYAQGERSSWLLGDSGYPLQPWLLTPIIGAVANTLQSRYNTRLTSARNTVERCIGVLKIRFRCLLRHQTLHYDPITSGKIIYACVALHNICVQNDLRVPEVHNQDVEIVANRNEVIDEENWLQEGRMIRDNFIANTF